MKDALNTSSDVSKFERYRWNGSQTIEDTLKDIFRKVFASQGTVARSCFREGFVFSHYGKACLFSNHFMYVVKDHVGKA